MYNEWRQESDIIDLTGEGSTVNQSSLNLPSNTATTDAVSVQQEFYSPAVKNFSLYEELNFKIKSLLVSARKGDPNCCVSMPFEEVHFDGLRWLRTIVVWLSIKTN